MFSRPTASCPVCKENLGYLIPRQICSFLCSECQFIFTWNGKGKLLPPVKVNRNGPKKCGCGSCELRDENDRRKYLY